MAFNLPSTPPTPVSQVGLGAKSGRYVGPDTVVTCCSVPLSISATLQVLNGDSASFNDPFGLILPAGWSYTLEPLVVPEPNSALLVLVGTAILAARRGRRNG